MVSIEWDKSLVESGAVKQIEEGQHQAAVQIAFVVLEERIRQKGDFDVNEFGAGLMKEAFNPTSGNFSIGETNAEKQGVMFLFAGAMQAFRNPMAHRFLDDFDKQKAIEILQFINLLLRLVEDNTGGEVERVGGEPTYRGRTLNDLIKGGEGETIEFKQQIPSHVDKIVKEIAALANTRGGVLLIGVADNGEVGGLEDAKEVEERISNAVRQLTNPPLHPRIEVRERQDAEVVIVNVQERETNPVEIDGQYYSRVGSTVQKMTFDEMKDRFL